MTVDVIENYKGGDDTIATDSSSKSNSGTLMNGPIWTAGKLSGALSFDGKNDVVLVDDDPSLKPLKELTISLWIKSKGPMMNRQKMVPLLLVMVLVSLV